MYFCNVEKISIHIEKLLAHHEYVVIPDFGGFVLQRQCADLQNDVITPPVYTIGFNPLMCHSDGLLALEIARSESISYRNACEIINAEIMQFRKNLNANVETSLGKLGYFCLGANNKPHFSPNIHCGFLPQNFGFAPVTAVPHSAKTEQTNRHITLNMPVSRFYRVAAAAMLAMALWGVTPGLNNQHKTAEANFSSILTINDTVENIAVKTSEEAVAVIDKQETEYFHVIVASLSTRASAEQYCNELRSDDFTGVHLVESTKLTRVAIQSFEDKDKAIKYMEHLRTLDSRFENAWVMCQ